MNCFQRFITFPSFFDNENINYYAASGSRGGLIKNGLSTIFLRWLRNTTESPDSLCYSLRHNTDESFTYFRWFPLQIQKAPDGAPGMPLWIPLDRHNPDSAIQSFTMLLTLSWSFCASLPLTARPSPIVLSGQVDARLLWSLTRLKSRASIPLYHRAWTHWLQIQFWYRLFTPQYKVLHSD